MKRTGLWLLVASLIVALGLGVASLYRMRVGRGDVFPEYSTLRADPLGTRALHDAVALLPGREVIRWTKPAERLQAGAGDLVVVAGLAGNAPWSDGGLDADGWSALDRAASNGARVVVAWRAQIATSDDAVSDRKKRADPWAEPPESKSPVVEKSDEKDSATDKAGTKAEVKADGKTKDNRDAKTGPKSDSKSDAKTKGDAEKKADAEAKAKRMGFSLDDTYATSYERRWGFRVLRRELIAKGQDADALRGESAPDAWPDALARWRSDLYFFMRAGDGWRVLYRHGVEPVMIERKRGAGSVVLMADTFPLSNEALQRERATPVIVTLLGDARRVVFVESHLGIEAESGIAVLARRYGLGGAALTALLVTGLWIWRHASPLAPVLPDEEQVRLTLAPTAGLEALLRRAVTPAKLFAACLDAWKTSASAGDRRRLDEATAKAAVSDPVAAYNETTKTLSHKRLS